MIEGHYSSSDIRYDLKQYDFHHAIFGGSLATGDNAVLTTDPYMRQANDADDYDSSGDEELDDTTIKTGPCSGDKRAGSSRGRKGKQKKGSTRADYESNMSVLTSILVSRFDNGISYVQSR